ncbi:SIR2 family NAD-dependent protein deacylase [Aliikangiella sp. IMCC44359]|uniref:SIR2 family NAD-dependent protein deacylase n=1 Tax=Aliikangiella sp. IMCC44359 TaxID=3459125 RepID=UPI00403AE0C7
MNKIDFSLYQQIVVLTGAGISVASGLKTYRGAGSDSSEYDFADYGHIDRLKDDPMKVWKLYGKLRKDIIQAQPNSAHYSLAEFERRLLPNQNFTLITQNVDGLHQKAGSKNIVELHGNMHKTRCSNLECKLVPFKDEKVYTELPICDLCKSPLLPDVVLFGEKIPAFADWSSKRALRECDLFIAVGTSGTVSPAANFVRSAEYADAKTILVNLEPMEPKNPAFQDEINGKAEELLPRLMA